MIDLVITPAGKVRCLYDETLDLKPLGPLDIRRGSYVEPDAHGYWTADLAPVSGPRLGPFDNRGAALAAEIAWLRTHWLPSPVD